MAIPENREKHRKRFQMIFQDPYASLNPRWRVGKIIAEPILSHDLIKDPVQLKKRVDELLTQVGLSPLDAEKFPHEFPAVSVNAFRSRARCHRTRNSWSVTNQLRHWTFRCKRRS